MIGVMPGAKMPPATDLGADNMSRVSFFGAGGNNLLSLFTDPLRFSLTAAPGFGTCAVRGLSADCGRLGRGRRVTPRRPEWI
jgi:hypothetical protein